MSNESKLILEIWDNVRDLIPASKREDTALQLLRAFEEYGFDFVISELEEEDDYLDAALAMLKDDEDEDGEELDAIDEY